MTGPADEIAAGQARLRASHTDREQVVGALQAAFVQGRLTADELGERVGQALAARTYAELAALTTDLPADPKPAVQPAPAPPQAPAPARRLQNPAARRAVKAGAGAIGVAVIALGVVIAVAGEPAAAVFVAVFMLFLAAAATAVVASLIHVALKLEARQRSRSRGQRPPGPETGPSAQRVQAPGADPPRPPHGLLATGLAG
jgi:uncharacterized protein DUF1707